MLDHPITVVLNVFWPWKATGFKVSKFMDTQKQEGHIGHEKQLKSDRYRDLNFFPQALHMCTHIFPKSVNLTLTVVFKYSYVISSS